MFVVVALRRSGSLENMGAIRKLPLDLQALGNELGDSLEETTRDGSIWGHCLTPS